MVPTNFNGTNNFTNRSNIYFWMVPVVACWYHLFYNGINAHVMVPTDFNGTNNFTNAFNIYYWMVPIVACTNKFEWYQ